MDKRNNLLIKKKIFKCCVFIFFIFMMVFNLMHSALWGDEWVEYNYSQARILNGDIFRRIVSTFQPPLYNLVMHFWLKISQSLFWFRLFNIIPGMISGIFLFQTVKRIINEKVAAFSLCALAVCYQWIYCIQECSEYALMLCFLFATVYFYVMFFENNSYLYMAMFILGSVLAIYSQYGAVFVVVPLLLLFYIGNVFNKSVDNKRKIIITISYIVCFVTFAIPLYWWVAKKQMAHNQISSHATFIKPDMLKDFPFVLGRIIGYLYNLGYEDVWIFLLFLFSIGLIVVSVCIIAKRRLPWRKKSLIIAFWLGYIMHYLLVQMHIYAMVHPDQSSGFYCRYSYFYIPLVSIVLPIMITEMDALFEIRGFAGFRNYITGAMIVCMALSFCSTLKNWNKSYDDQFAQIWMENSGWEDTTYLYGVASYGFNYYVSHSEGYKEGYLDNAITSVDNDNLPLRFWAWRTNWDGDGWQETIDTAKELGYTVTIYNDSGFWGQLAFCSYEGKSKEKN